MHTKNYGWFCHAPAAKRLAPDAPMEIDILLLYYRIITDSEVYGALEEGIKELFDI